MVAAEIAQVRSFNRIVTQRIGALDDRYLSRDRPLGECRVLWEVGDDGCDARELRSRLDLDSGYHSRLLRSLEDDGLIVVEPSARDRRVRSVRLTRAGRAEWRQLDRSSDELARTLLEPLSERSRERLVSAMSEVERLLTASLVDIDAVDPARPEAQVCLQAYFAELGRRFETGFDPVRSPTNLDEFRPPLGLFLVATLRSEPVACAGIKLRPGEPAEVKRMWVADSVRGVGLGRRLLAEIERRSAEAGAPCVRLETNAALTEAIGLYRSAGYTEIEPFNDEPYAHHWFEKQLAR